VITKTFFNGTRAPVRRGQDSQLFLLERFADGAARLSACFWLANVSPASILPVDRRISDFALRSRFDQFPVRAACSIGSA
jgi:hypothetical protein